MTGHHEGILPPDHPARPGAVLALRLSLAAAVAFTLFAYVTTQVRAVRAGSPWQGDPYDAVVSFTLFLVPALAALTTGRAVLYRRSESQPVHRIDQLLRAASLSTVLIAATVVTDWAAVALRADHQLWNKGTPWLIAALIPVTTAALAALTLERKAFHRLPPGDRRRPDGDWLDDLAILTGALTARLPGPLRRLTARIDTGAVTGFARSHIVAVAGTASLSAGLLLALGQALGEGWPGTALFLTETAVNAGGLFAFCMLCNAVLRIAVPRDVGRQNAKWRGAARSAAVAGSVAVPVSGALRDTIWALIGQVPQTHSPARLAALVFAGALLTGAVTFVVSIARRRKD